MAAESNDLITDPPEITMKCGGDKFSLQLINITTKKICFKVKLSNNEMYRIAPVYGIIDAGQGMPLEIERMPGSAKTDKLVVEYMYCTGKPTSAEQYFKANTKKGSVNVKINAS